MQEQVAAEAEEYKTTDSETVGGGSSDAVFYGGGSEGCGGYAEDV